MISIILVFLIIGLILCLVNQVDLIRRLEDFELFKNALMDSLEEITNESSDIASEASEIDFDEVYSSDEEITD